MSTSVLRSVVFAAAVVGLAASGPNGFPNTDAAPRADIGAATSRTDTNVLSDSMNQEIDRAPQLASISSDDVGQARLQTEALTQPQTQVATAEPSLGSAGAAAPVALNLPSSPPELPVVDTAPSNAAQTPSADAPTDESASVQLASASPLDDSFTFKDLAEILRRADMGAKAFGFIAHSCTANDSCDVDHYLWALYQRTPKEDTVRETEIKEITIDRKVKGKTKTVTITQASSKAVRQDFGWKDPKAAERAGMPLMDYVIGGMDPSFKLKLYNMLRAAEAAGFSPGITSGFRDDYRQSIASGLKAASNMSYHGGSRHGGYGHGMAADVVNVAGGSRDMRFISSSMFWNWIDANGHAYGIGRPYLGRDPPHVAPTDGAEYAKHRGGVRLATTDVKLLDLPPSLGLKNLGLNKEDDKKKNAENANAKKLDTKPERAKKTDAKASNTKESDARKSDDKKAKRVDTRDNARPAKRKAAAATSKP